MPRRAIYLGSLPCVYRLQVSNNALSILVRADIWRNFFCSAFLAQSNYGSAGDYERLLGLKFYPPVMGLSYNEQWGYEGAIKTVGEEGSGWFRLSLSLPKIDDPNSAWELLKPFNASVSLVLRILDFVLHQPSIVGSVTNKTSRQLLTVELSVGKGEGLAEYPMAANYGPEVVKWIHRATQTDFDLIAQAMHEAAGLLFPLRKEFGFLNTAGIGVSMVYKDGHYLTIDAADRVGLVCYGHTRDTNDCELGYQVDCTNPDSLLHQTLLIVGLAKLYELVEVSLL